MNQNRHVNTCSSSEKKKRELRSYVTSVAQKSHHLTNQPEASWCAHLQTTPPPNSAQMYGYLKLLIATRKEKESNKGFKVNWEWNSGPLAQKAAH